MRPHKHKIYLLHSTYITLHNQASFFEVLLIGDTIHDCEVAQEIGADPILLSVGHQARKKLEKCKVPLIESLSELVGKQ